MILAVILLLLLFLLVIYNIFATIRAIIKWLFGDYINTYLLLADIDPLYKAPIEKYCHFYRRLNPTEKKTFEKRVQKFINQKQFIPRGMDRITDEMKALIAGAAIQLTFGYPSIYFAHFRRILCIRTIIILKFPSNIIKEKSTWVDLLCFPGKIL